MVVSGPIEVVLVLFLVSGGVAWWLLLEQMWSLYLCMLLTRAEVACCAAVLEALG